MQGRTKTNRLCLMALLTAIALTIFMVEAQLPALAPVPGMKLGLANIVTVWALFTLGARDALLILLARIFLGSVFSGQLMTLAYSLSGGLLCFLVTAGLRRAVTVKQIWVASVFGAMAHNLGQLLAAAAIMGTSTVWYYFPILMISGVVTGAFTGLGAQFLYGHLERLDILKRRNI